MYKKIDKNVKRKSQTLKFVYILNFQKKHSNRVSVKEIRYLLKVYHIALYIKTRSILNEETGFRWQF